MAKQGKTSTPQAKKTSAAAIAANLAGKSAVNANVGELFKQEAGKKTVLHVGCGAYHPDRLAKPFRGSEWREIRLDSNAAYKPHVVAELFSMPQVPDNSADAIWSSHSLKSLHAFQVPLALKEFWRVLKMGGILLLNVPDLQKVSETIVLGNLESGLYTSPAGPITPLDIVFGHSQSIARGSKELCHYTGFTAKTLGLKLRDAKFYAVEIQRFKYELSARAVKLPDNHPSANKDIVFKVDDNHLPDELDAPPVIWQSLGLKNKP